MNVAERTSRASRANSASSYAATGRLCTTGRPSSSKTPRPTPSGSRLLWTARLSGASSSQNVAVMRCGAAESPNRRHMEDLRQAEASGIALGDLFERLQDGLPPVLHHPLGRLGTGTVPVGE